MAAIHSSLISPNAKTPPCTLWRPRAGAREITKKNARCGIVGISGSAIGIIVDLPWGLPPLVQLKGADSAPRSWLKPGFGKVFCWFLWGWRQGEGSKTYCYLFQTSNSSDIRLWGVEFHLFPGKQPNLPCFFWQALESKRQVQVSRLESKVAPIQSWFWPTDTLGEDFESLGHLRRIHPWTLFQNQGWDGSWCRWGAKPYKTWEVAPVETNGFCHEGIPAFSISLTWIQATDAGEGHQDSEAREQSFSHLSQRLEFWGIFRSIMYYLLYLWWFICL